MKRVVGLEGDAREIGDVPRSARIQPFSETTTVIGSRSIIASSIAASSCSGASAKVVRRLPSAVFGPKAVRTSLICGGDALPLRRLGAEQVSSRLLLGPSSLSSFRISISSSLRRIAQPHVEDRVGLHVGELEALHQDGLRLVLLADDLDHLVEVEIGDQRRPPSISRRCSICARRWRERRSSTSRRWSSHSRSASARPTTFGMRPFDQHVHVERNAALQLGELEQRLHQQRRIDVRARGSITRRTSSADLVAHVGEQRQLLLVEQLGDASRPGATSAPARGSR